MGTSFLRPLELAVTGRIKQIVRSRACGFIRASDGQHVFFHASDLPDGNFNDMVDSLAVRFTLVADPISGPRAIEVRIDVAKRAH
jgi:cold shock CspA family protein